MPTQDNKETKSQEPTTKIKHLNDQGRPVAESGTPDLGTPSEVDGQAALLNIGNCKT